MFFPIALLLLKPEFAVENWVVRIYSYILYTEEWCSSGFFFIWQWGFPVQDVKLKDCR
jgi:hypothetical protein